MKIFPFSPFFIFLLTLCSSFLSAKGYEVFTTEECEEVELQEFITLKQTPAQIEKLFLEQNLQLIAESMNITLAEANVVQAKLWDNPELSVESVNFWNTQNQRKKAGIEPFPKNIQLGIELSQRIQTANKRGKLVDREKVSREIAVQDFECLLIELKMELRKVMFEIKYLQSYRDVLQGQHKKFEQLISAFKKQEAQGNIAKSELIRLQSGLLEVENEINRKSAFLLKRK